MGLFLVSLFLGITSWVSIDLSAENGLLHRWVAQHKARVYSLYLWVWENVGIKTTEDNLIITNWIVVWDASSYSKSTGASIWWWVGNTIESNSQYAGIAWWWNNTIVDGENSIIGWWSNNSIDGKNAVVAWWQNNTSHSWWNVMWWVWNSASGNSVVLWWEGNMAEENSLALWKDSDAQYKSFAWNAIAEPNSARINASNWVLIWTTQPITWVNLVVNWAMKIGWTSSATWVAWEIRSVSWCFYAYDWVIWHIINRNSRWDCNTFTVSEVCKFGNIELQEWDVVIGYRAIISTGCDSSDNRREVRCTNWELLDSEWNTGFDSPYCYTGRGNLVSFTPPVTCPSIGSCRNIAAWWTCISYSVWSSSNCTGAKITSTCNDDWTWSVTPWAYWTCEPPVAKCAAIWACPETEVWWTCVSYSASWSTNCTGVKITSTCNTNWTWSATPWSYWSCTVKCAAAWATCESYRVSSSPSCAGFKVTSTCNANWTWSATPWNYWSCTAKCPAVWSCAETMPWWTCVSYSASSSTNCGWARITSTCNSNWTWSVTPWNYWSCTAKCAAVWACPEAQSWQVCVSYSASWSTNCGWVRITSTCNANWTWSVTPWNYLTCNPKCAAAWACPESQAWQICVSYSASWSANCGWVKITSTCNMNQTTDTIQWNVTPWNYWSCTVKCAAAWACPETEVWWICESYSASSSTNCGWARITSTCNSNWTWNVTPWDYWSCTAKCAAVWACSETMPWWTCVSYSASWSTNCDWVKVTSTCNSNWTWNVTPWDYWSCTAQCQAWYYKDWNECVECPAWSYCPWWTEAISCPSRTYSTWWATSCTACGLDAVYVSRSSPTWTYYYAPGYIYTNNNPWTLYFYVKTPAWDDNWNISTVQIANNTNLSASIVTRSWKKAIQVSYTYASDWTSHSPGWVGYVNVYWEGEIADAYRASCWRVSPGTFAFYNSLSNCTTNSNQVCQSWEYSYCCVQ